MLWLLLAMSLYAVEPAEEGYQALKSHDYDRAVTAFREALAKLPDRIEWRRELAYTLLKMGETAAARDEFARIRQLAPRDEHASLEYAYLCNETRRVREARQVFDSLRQSQDASIRQAAEQAFQNVDRPLEAAIARWRTALEHNPDDFSAHAELARAAEERGDAKLAAEHYRRAWHLRPAERSLLVALGRMLEETGDRQQSMAVFLAASRGPSPRAAEEARDHLPERYPYVSEFRSAINFDRQNIELRRELAYLLLAIQQPQEAEAEFEALLVVAPDDLLSLTQLGMMRLGRGDAAGARPLLEKVAAGSDPVLADKAATALGRATGLKAREPEPARPSAPAPAASDAKTMGDRSYEKGYLKDAARYFLAALEANPADHEAGLKLGRTYNMLHQDEEALRYFEMARSSRDPQIRREASQAYRNLRGDTARVRFTAWMLPMFSSRWHEGFGYGQIKTEFRAGKLPLKPYLSLRFVGDTQRAGLLAPQYLSEGSFIGGVGVATRPWHGLTAWAEAGSALRYRHRTDVGRAIPDYRGGLSFGKGIGHSLSGGKPGWFAEATADFVTLSRFRWDSLVYSQNRAGVTLPRAGMLESQLTWSGNLTFDRKREPWANFAETGPGIRLRLKPMPPSMVWTVDVLRGQYLIQNGNPRPPVYYDIRAGVWYALSY